MLKTHSYLLLFPVILVLCGFFWSDPTWQEINSSIDRKYPSAQNIDIEGLQITLNKGTPVTIIDVRQETEYEVSHLPGAINVTRLSAVNYHKESLLVIYCSVGVRSAKFAVGLSKLGYSRVVNLRGGIFAWANTGYPLMRGDMAVHVVHPYNKQWGKLLNPKLHSYTTDSP